MSSRTGSISIGPHSDSARGTVLAGAVPDPDAGAIVVHDMRWRAHADVGAQAVGIGGGMPGLVDAGVYPAAQMLDEGTEQSGSTRPTSNAGSSTKRADEAGMAAFLLSEPVFGTTYRTAGGPAVRLTVTGSSRSQRSSPSVTRIKATWIEDLRLG